MERLDQGETIICAEGYLLALTRRGYIDPDSFIPEFMLDQTDALKTLHYEFIHSGTDVTEAFQVKCELFKSCITLVTVYWRNMEVEGKWKP